MNYSHTLPEWVNVHPLGILVRHTSGRDSHNSSGIVRAGITAHAVRLSSYTAVEITINLPNMADILKCIYKVDV